MGALVSAPISALGTCLGGCAGSCIAVSCGRLAGSGEVSSARAARCVLVWLQAFTAAVALLAAATPGKWLPWVCGKLDYIGAGEVGICDCKGSTEVKEQCWSDQLVYRAEASGLAVFLCLLLMTISGCAHGASRSHAVGKFMAVPVLAVVLLFVPNDVLGAFGTFATSASAIFLVAQALLLIDLAYSWNELWHGYALMAQRREVGHNGRRRWLGAILAASSVLFIASVVVSIWLYSTFPGSAGRAINIIALVCSFLLLCVSITDWCEHGALLTSCVVMAYSVWLVVEALASQPGNAVPRPPALLGLALCTASLVASAWGAGFAGSEGSGSAAASSANAVVAEEGAAVSDDQATAARTPMAPETEVESGRMTNAERKDFALQCTVHAAASIYVASALAPKAGTVPFVFHAISVFAALVLYGWSLVAPKILTNRNFS